MLKNTNKIPNNTIYSPSSEVIMLDMSLQGAAPLANLGLRRAGISNYTAPYQLMRNGLEEPRHAIIIFIIEGKLKLEIENQDYDLTPGDFIYVASHVARKITLCEGLTNYKEVFFWVEFGSGADIFRHNEIVVHSSTCHEQILHCIEGFIKEDESVSPSRYQIRKLNAELISQYLQREFSSIKATFRSVYQNKITQLKDQIRQNLDEKWSVERIAEYLHVSKTQCFRLIEKYENSTPLQLINRIKMQRARELLCFTELSLDQIAVQLNYTNAYSFSRAFFKYFGTRPGKYRSSLKE